MSNVEQFEKDQFKWLLNKSNVLINFIIKYNKIK